MDDPNRQRRLNDSVSQQNVPNSRYASQSSRAVAGAAHAERFRSAPVNSPQTPRALAGNAGYSSYYPDSNTPFPATNIPSTAMGTYGSEYAHDGRLGNYNTAAMMYNVAQPNSQAPVYDAQQFGSRQTAAMQMMPPDVASTYFGADAAANPSASGLQQPAHGTSSSAGVYQQSPSMNYASTMPGVSAVQQAAANADVSINEDTNTNNEFSDGALEEKWISYQRQLGSVFQDILSGSLENASETLLTISGWLLSQVVDLGLTLDDSSLHADRLKLWNDFNHAWLALGSQQKDLAESGRQLSRTQRLMSQATVEKLGSELVRLCDGLERHGLVDYQYGVWEDQIIAVLEECLDLFESEDRADASMASR
ncbi:unnamed protein product [Clonostachys byssicola]|uniref:Uncharacterized protein n=1 Tax=Clonostachys byssicola TaxID=160290 RepID=A0A9N9URD6_9HYPO|nr:unnamed protein product [Clonostachys byssicola]